MKLSVIIPVYNEAATVEEVVERVAKLPLETEIIVVDDGSTDATPQVLANGCRGRLAHLCTLPTNRGKGAAVRAGLRKAAGAVVVIQDADLELCPEDVPALVEPLARGAAVVYGSRFRAGRGQCAWGAYLLNRALTTFANLLFGSRLTDVATGYKVFRADVLRSLDLECVGFEFCPEVTAKVLRAGHEIQEVPVTYTPRPPGAGKKLRILRDGARAVWTLLKWRLK
jgi:glycosyltransferase involved in cell wall biosynthesis